MTALRAAEPPIASARDAAASHGIGASLGAAASAGVAVPGLRISMPGLRISWSVVELRQQLRAARGAGLTIGLVPTMGALHDGHLSLIRAARRKCDLVVVSVFVNPTQFDEQADLAGYPRDVEGDARLARKAGADLLFAPAPQEIYRPGFATTVEVHGLTDRLEGAVRGRAHFRGVTTVVCKLLNIVAPEIAFFGQKDAQQAAVIRRMVADLDIDVQIETLPIVREPDGLALSSRNVRLGAAEREQAPALHAALTAAADRLAAGERSGPGLIAAAREALAPYGVQPEYVALVDQDSFEDLDRLCDSGLLLIAARIGQTRLIDNLILGIAREGGREPARPHPAEDSQPDQGETIAACSA